MFTIKMDPGIVAKSFQEEDLVYISPDKLLPLSRFTGGGGGGGGGRGRGGGRGKLLVLLSQRCCTIPEKLTLVFIQEAEEEGVVQEVGVVEEDVAQEAEVLEAEVQEEALEV